VAVSRNYVVRAALVLVLITTVAQGQLWAESWPRRNVRFIVPLGPGSGVDIGARLFAERLASQWGRPVVVENRPGGDAIVAITAFTSAHDDHTLLVAPVATFTAHPFLHDAVPYDQRDLVPIARISETIVAVSVPSSLNIGSVKDLVEFARAQPGKLNWTTATGFTDFLFAGFLLSQGMRMAKVPYRDPVQAVNDLAEDRIQVYMPAFAIVRPQVQAGKVKVLAVTNDQRARVLPDVPTVVEAGYPELAFDGLVGLFGPREMSTEVRDRIAADIRTVAGDPAVDAQLTTTGQIVSPGSSAEFAVSIQQQRASVAAVARIFGNKPVQ